MRHRPSHTTRSGQHQRTDLTNHSFPRRNRNTEDAIVTRGARKPPGKAHFSIAASLWQQAQMATADWPDRAAPPVQSRAARRNRPQRQSIALDTGGMPRAAKVPILIVACVYALIGKAPSPCLGPQGLCFQRRLNPRRS